MTGSGPPHRLADPRARPVVTARRLTKRAGRERAGAFLVEGPQAVREAVAEPGALRTLFVSPAAEERYADLVRAAADTGVAVVPVTEGVLATLAETVTPQGLVGVAPFRHRPLAEVLADRPALVAVLAEVRDPGNAGTVVRTADAAGAGAVVFTDASVDPYNGKCVRASAGSLFHVPFAVGVPALDAVTALRAAGLRVLAASGDGRCDLDELADASGLDRPTGWLFGNEAWGLPPEVTAAADATIRVPIHGRAESLNLATAAAVCLYASARALRRR